MTDVRATLLSGTHHSVNFSDLAFLTAAMEAFRLAFAQASRPGQPLPGSGLLAVRPFAAPGSGA
ncbi:hypothetical protein [Deinococcus hopiensis]|uniref:hypothetical protein n=1 Tax=Deinococcus hopiensis TaxID=309885 RepID=UPI000A019407